MLSTLDLRCEEKVVRWRWKWSQSDCAIRTPETAKKRSVGGSRFWFWVPFRQFELRLDGFIPFFIPFGPRAQSPWNKQPNWNKQPILTELNVWKQNGFFLDYVPFFYEIASKTVRNIEQRNVPLTLVLMETYVTLMTKIGH
jgi:hypothetical protein